MLALLYEPRFSTKKRKISRERVYLYLPSLFFLFLRDDYRNCKNEIYENTWHIFLPMCGQVLILLTKKNKTSSRKKWIERLRLLLRI